MTLPHYTFRAEWPPEDEQYVGLVVEFPSLSFLGTTELDAFQGIIGAVAEVVADMTAAGESVPSALADRRYSGNLSIRTSPAQHRALIIEAAEQGVSLNQWINYRLGCGS